MLLFDFGCSAAEFEIGPSDKIEDTLGCGNNVEGGRNGTSVLKVRDPQFASGKFPLYIGFFLHKKRNKKEKKVISVEQPRAHNSSTEVKMTILPTYLVIWK